MRTFCIFVALLVSWASHAQTATVSIEVDATQVGAVVRDLFGVNRKPTFSTKTSAQNWNAASLSPAFGVSQVLLHDSQLDLCTTYTAANKVNSGVSPVVNVPGCTLTGSDEPPHFKWTPTSSTDADLNNPANYDFTAVDGALRGVIASGAGISPPPGVHDIGVSGNPSTVNAGELATLLASMAQETRSNLAVSNGQLELTASIPARSATSVTIHFLVASDGGSPISRYRVTCTSFGRSPLTANSIVSPIIVSGLARNVAYSCSLVAQNTIGSSAASATHAVAARPTSPLSTLLLLD